MLRPFAPRFFRPFVVAACLATAAAASVVACTDSSTDVVLTPITGVIVRSETLTRSLGCGDTGDVMYKYAAVVFDKLGAPRASGIYDCFADATIVSLTPAATDAGALDFTIQIYAFNKGAYDTQAVGADPQAVDRFFQVIENVTPLSPTWSVLCSATQQANVSVLAVCGVPALGKAAFGGSVGGEAGFAVPLDKLVGPSGAPAVCNSRFVSASVHAHTDATGTQGPGLTDFLGTIECPFTPVPDAGAGDGGDAGDAGSDADAGPPTGPLPSPFLAVNAIAPATFTVEVTLFDEGGAASRATTCTAATSYGVVSTAVCAPLRDAP